MKKDHISQSTSTPCDKNILLENYRICFDAMRAYHSSEIHHKAHTIDILKSVITAAVIMHSGILGYVFIEDQYFNEKIGIAATLLLFIVLSITVWVIIRSTIIKIYGDSNRYEKYRNEGIIMRNQLGLSKTCESHSNLYWGISINASNSTRDGQGNIKTNMILICFGILIVAISFLTSSFTIYLLLERINTNSTIIQIH